MSDQKITHDQFSEDQKNRIDPQWITEANQNDWKSLSGKEKFVIVTALAGFVCIVIFLCYVVGLGYLTAVTFGYKSYSGLENSTSQMFLVKSNVVLNWIFTFTGAAYVCYLAFERAKSHKISLV